MHHINKPSLQQPATRAQDNTPHNYLIYCNPNGGKKRSTCTKNLKIHKTAIALPAHLGHLLSNQFVWNHPDFSKQQSVHCAHSMPKKTVEDEWKWSAEQRGATLGSWVGRSISKPDLRPSHQDLLSHLLDLLRLGLNVILQFVLPPLHHLQPLYLVLQGLPALLLTPQKWYKTNCAAPAVSQKQTRVIGQISMIGHRWFTPVPRSLWGGALMCRWSRFCLAGAPGLAPAAL